MLLHFITEENLPIDLIDNPLPIEKILYEYVEPLLYLTRNKQGDLLLAYVFEEYDIFLSPISKEQCDALESCQLSVRDALTHSWMWKVTYWKNELTLSKIKPEGIPDFCLPNPGVMLYPSTGLTTDVERLKNDLKGEVYGGTAVREYCKALFESILNFLRIRR